MENDAYQDETSFGGAEMSAVDVETPTEVKNSEEKRESSDEKKSQADNASVDIPADKLDDGEIPEAYAGMPAEVLLHYSRRRPWQIGRLVGWLAVLSTFIILISLSVVIIVQSPPCLDFWEKSPIYQIYPRSFKDCSNNWREENGLKRRDELCDDGIGDIAGIIEKLDYLNEDLGISIIWLSPVFQSPMEDFGYDVSDYRQIDPIFGDLSDIEELIELMHDRGMKLILDFVPNHTSIQNKFFTDIIDNEELWDRYIWHEGNPPEGCAMMNAIHGNTSMQVPNRECDMCANEEGTGGPMCPNNWQGVFAQSDEKYLPAWTYHPLFEKYYYHAFGWFQPDVNMRNEDVTEELNSVLDFWLDKGVDGFRVDAIGYAYEQPDFRDEISIDPEKPGWWINQHHDFTFEYGPLHDLIMGFRKTLDKYSTEPGVDRFMVTEAYSYSYETLMRYYGTSWEREADFPFNFDLIWVGRDGFIDKEDLDMKIQDWMFNMPDGKVANWVVGNHDRLRLASRIPGLSDENVKKVSKQFAQLTMTLPGTNFIYNGEEIGMLGLTVDELPDGCKVDIQEDTRDVCRNPMQWTKEEENNYGFSDCDKSNHTNVPETCELEICTWLPMSKSGSTFNVEDEKEDENSVLNYYKWIIEFRNRDEFTRGSYCAQTKDTVEEANILRYLRYLEGGEVYEVIFNWGESASEYTLADRHVIRSFDGPNPGVDNPGLDGNGNGKLEAYGQVILALGHIPESYKATDGTENCVQRRAVKKTSSDLILTM